MNATDLQPAPSVQANATGAAMPSPSMTGAEDPEPQDPLRATSLSYQDQPRELATPNFADGTFAHLHPHYIKLERIGWAIFGGFVSLGLLIAFPIVLLTSGVFSLPPYALLAGGMVVVAPIVVAGIFHPRKSWQTTTYAVSPLGLEIRRGIWWKHVIDVPRSRIQHTDVAQGPLARSFGIGKLIVYTAGTEHASVELDGLEYERAVQMRDFLLRGGEDDAV